MFFVDNSTGESYPDLVNHVKLLKEAREAYSTIKKCKMAEIDQLLKKVEELHKEMDKLEDSIEKLDDKIWGIKYE